tara:strand:+ start:5665 stop:6357 length:693 start_codon:yes stop_codon:yes gene_type:complete
MDRMPVVEMPPVENYELNEDLEDGDELAQKASDEQYNHIPEELEEQFKKTAVADRDELEEEEEPPKKKHIDNDEIFKKSKADMKVKPVKKPKRQITEEHRERLRKGREKALANRRAKAAEKKKAKENPKPEPDKVEPNEVEVEKPVAKEVIKEVIVEKVVPQQKSEQDIIDLVSKASRKAVEDYEILRKERKAEKLKKKEQEMERASINKIIKKATSTGLDINNPWANCY